MFVLLTGYWPILDRLISQTAASSTADKVGNHYNDDQAS